jgi:hypothetical protein
MASFRKGFLQGKNYNPPLKQVRDENTPLEKSESSTLYAKHDSLWIFLQENYIRRLELSIFSSTPILLLMFRLLFFKADILK